MKKFAGVFIGLFLFSSSPSIAASNFEPATDRTANVDVSLAYGGEPYNTGMGITLGGGVGISYMSTASTALRADVNYFNYSKTSAGVTVNYSRMPIFLGFRFFQSSQLPYYYEMGVEASNDGGSGNTSSGSTRFGLTPGIGAEAPIGDKFYAGGNIRYHFVTDPYYNVSISFGVKF